jgi:hypothetical protein
MAAPEPVLRAPRAAFFAAVCTLVSAAGHLVAGGGLVPVSAGALGAALVFALAYALGGRERGLDVLVPATLVAQVLLHRLFARPVAAGGAVPHHHAYPVLGMALAHVCVAVLTAWWLHRGESALWLMVRLYGRPPTPMTRWDLLARPALDVAPARVPAAVPAPGRPRGRLLVDTALLRRGPPAAGPAF